MHTRYAVAARLTGPPVRHPAPLPPQPATVVDLLWAHATAADRLDHVRVRTPEPAGGLELLVLLRAETDADAILTADDLLGRAARSPALSGWHADGFRVLPLAALDT
ncbi:hypothetical protein [Kitasatospora sp. LaBMicrA B282]|uniref:hypothetical protein n=1 Tax=Kitasatospora sp. LaBMicrA B282 TaxID=3420949 RepID=UPI003D0E1757